MAKIREDLVGVVSAGGLDLEAGDTVPDGVEVGDHVLEPEAKPVKVENSADEDEKPRRGRRKSDSDGE